MGGKDLSVSSLPTALQLKILSLIDNNSSSANSPQPPPTTDTTPLQPHVKIPSLLTDLATKGYAIADKFLDSNLADEVLQACQDLQRNGQLRAAGMGTGITRYFTSRCICKIVLLTLSLPREQTFGPIYSRRQHPSFSQQ